jgi:colanic acid biosynthesis protein WcaH
MEAALKTADSIKHLESLIQDPTLGLPDEIFKFITRITPMINVDLLIRNRRNQTLLTWRDDGHYLPSWHVPGGIVRFRETISNRIQCVAANELGARVRHAGQPIKISEIIDSSRRYRGHFISLLYECRLVGTPDKDMEFRTGVPLPGQWAWHDKCPKNLIPVHEIYRKFI